EYGVKAVTDYAVDKVDKGIDKLGEIGKEKTSELKAQANKIATEFVEQQTQSIATAIADNFTGPLVQSITPALSKVNAEKTNAKEQLKIVLKETWTSIGNNIPTGKDSLSVGGLTRELYDKLNGNIDVEIDSILSKVDFSDLKAGEIENLINEKVIGTKNDEGKFQFSDGSWLGKIKGSLDTAVKSAADGLETKLNEGIDQGVDNLKEYANEKIEEAGDKLAEKSTKLVSDYVSKNVTIGTKSTSVAAKVTMNYKEYCKLFIFIGLLGNQEDAMMQRAAALMQVNVKYAVKGTPDGKPQKAGTEDFHMTQAYTLFTVEADMKLGTLFPWAVKVETDDTGMNASPDFSHLGGNYVNMKYSGLAGY
ncbi:MAG: hypothetical protein K2G25_04850, partial [Oscillospiraceae bacterium]|nr:hypothetical protein [Oscillospiraceae bacterium]